MTPTIDHPPSDDLPNTAAAPPPSAAVTNGPATAGAPNGKPDKGGAPAANGNRLRSGLYADPDKQAIRLQLGVLPPGMARVEREARVVRRAIEAAVIQRHGGITIHIAFLVHEAATWWRHGAIARWWLKENQADMDHATRLAHSREAARASTECRKAIEAIGLDKTAAEAWDPATLYQRPPLLIPPDNATAAATCDDATADAPTAIPPPDNATAATVGNLAEDGWTV